MDDVLLPPEPQDSDVEFVAYLDAAARSRMQLGSAIGWQIREPVYTDTCPRRRSRHHKCLAHELFPHADYSLWIDGSMRPKSPSLRQLAEHMLADADVCAFEHSQRSHVLDELRACAARRKDDVSLMRRQIAGYFDEGFADDCGLVETGAILRRHTPQAAALGSLWWAEISKGSYRDQLSFNYCCWRLDLNYATFDGLVRQNPHFEFRQHQVHSPGRSAGRSRGRTGDGYSR